MGVASNGRPGIARIKLTSHPFPPPPFFYPLRFIVFRNFYLSQPPFFPPFFNFSKAIYMCVGRYAQGVQKIQTGIENIY